jgi:hypothetical protein
MHNQLSPPGCSRFGHTQRKGFRNADKCCFLPCLARLTIYNHLTLVNNQILNCLSNCTVCTGLANAAKPASYANLLCSFVNQQMIELSSIKSSELPYAFIFGGRQAPAPLSTLSLWLQPRRPIHDRVQLFIPTAR